MFTSRQQAAWDNPCVRADQTVDPKFHRDILYGGLIVSTLLSLNFGLE